MEIQSLKVYVDKECSGVWRHKVECCMDSSAIDCQVTRDALHSESDALHLKYYI